MTVKPGKIIKPLKRIHSADSVTVPFILTGMVLFCWGIVPAEKHMVQKPCRILRSVVLPDKIKLSVGMELFSVSRYFFQNFLRVNIEKVPELCYPDCRLLKIQF